MLFTKKSCILTGHVLVRVHVVVYPVVLTGSKCPHLPVMLLVLLNKNGFSAGLDSQSEIEWTMSFFVLKDHFSPVLVVAMTLYLMLVLILSIEYDIFAISNNILCIQCF